MVKKFPETPIVYIVFNRKHLTCAQYKILELIQQWHATLCVSSRYRHDFKHVGDMYRLLIYKGKFLILIVGYRFPDLAEESKVGLITPTVS